MKAMDRFRLDGRVALVTGASSGFGRHFALTLAEAGAAVALAARRLDALEAVAAEIRGKGGKAMAVSLDVTKPAAVAPAFDAAEEALGPVGICVNNAGVPHGNWFAKITDEEWRHVLDVNLDGVFWVGREAARRMQAGGKGGSIINVASILGLGAQPALTPYMASKGAVVQMTKGMALDLARYNIRVNALAPGYVSTDLNSEFLASPAGQNMITRVPMRRWGMVEELDGPLLLLASDAGSWMTGSVLVADGGHVMAMG
jgi:NAD(P)-dependent dehydrogenase (short-subunit alcohol dehydrogenase family)